MSINKKGKINMSIFTEGKDKIISKGLKTFANIIINDYGKITDFAANTKNKTITLNVLLKGEKEDLQITFSNYSVISDDKNTYFKFDSIRTTREWLNILFEKKLSKILEENKIQIPGYIATSINIFL